MTKYRIEPNASSILGSLRSLGYDLQTALADIIDNCIAANSKEIEIVNNDLQDGAPKLEWIAIVDDGNGMSMEEMINAFILGGDGIESYRGEKDLGRFGLGLKTASFSQCRKLTLISKTKTTKVESLVFDLDYIITNESKWEAYTLEDCKDVFEKISPRLNNKEIFKKDSFTIVFWEVIDKINNSNLNKFNSELTEKVANHLALVFHKFEHDLKIRLNKTKIEFWNPFQTAMSSKSKSFDFDSSGNNYSVKTHVLKHISEFPNVNEYKDQSRNGTFNQNQGFFVYRKNRLIFRGNWLGLFNKEHHYILARVEINLTNTLESDEAWRVDVSKSSVIIPDYAINDLINECNQVRTEANNVFRYHGGIVKHKIRLSTSDNEIQPIWNFETKGNKSGAKDFYLLNKEHPVIKNFLESLSKEKELKAGFLLVMKYIENYLPIDNIFARKATQEIEQPKQENEEMYQEFKSIFNICLKSMNSESAFEMLIKMEPYNRLSFDENMLNELKVKFEKK